jgi:hypothetical protein
MQARDDFIGLRVESIGMESCLARLQHMSENRRNSGCIIAYLQDYCELGFHAKVKGPHLGRLLRECDADVSVAGPSVETADGASVERSAPPTSVARLPFEQWPRAWNDASENHGQLLLHRLSRNTSIPSVSIATMMNRNWRWRCLRCGSSRRPWRLEESVYFSRLERVTRRTAMRSGSMSTRNSRQAVSQGLMCSTSFTPSLYALEATKIGCMRNDRCIGEQRSETKNSKKALADASDLNSTEWVLGWV